VKRLSAKARRKLGELQQDVLRLAADRSLSIRVLSAARSTTMPSAQSDFWLEYLWIEHEYRCAVKRLAQYCLELEASAGRHSSRAADVSA
jgi:hypothetical protein